MWEGNKSQTCFLESVILGGTNGSLGVLLRPVYNKVVRGDILQSRRDRAKLK